MERTTKIIQLWLLLIGAISFSACKKDDAKHEDLATVKKGWLTGTWKQKDVVLAYPIPFAGQELPVGFSLYNIADYLPISGPLITCTADNTFTFDQSGSFTITGCTDLILPNTGSSGTWNLQVYGSALHLVSTDNKDTPLWIDKISSTYLKMGSLSFTIHIAEADADIPVYLILEKE
jgi:hypothetical protein